MSPEDLTCTERFSELDLSSNTPIDAIRVTIDNDHSRFPSLHNLQDFDEAIAVTAFYEDLRAVNSYFVKIKVVFYACGLQTPPLHLCHTCGDYYLNTKRRFEYFDFVTWHDDSFKVCYLCSFCFTKLYTIESYC